MKSRDHISSITEHAKSEGVFTTAQAARFDILRDALSDVASPDSEFDCARLQEMLVGKYDEAKRRSISNSYRSTCSPEKFSPCVRSRACSMVKLPETIWGIYSVACSSAWLNRSWKLAVLTVFVKGLIHAAR